MMNFWAVQPNAMPNESIDKMVEFFDNNYELAPGELIQANVDEEIRSCSIAWVGGKQGDAFINTLLWRYVLNINSNAFGFDIDYLSDLQYTVYESNVEGHYNWHRDSWMVSNSMFDRKLTAILQLSDPSEYEGGELLIEDDFTNNTLDYDLLKQKGTLFIFPSFVKHTVMPVTRGTRKSLVGWAHGPKFR